MDKNKKLVVQDQQKRGKFNASSHSFLNALGALLLNSGAWPYLHPGFPPFRSPGGVSRPTNGYVTFSMADPRDEEWFALSVAVEYLVFVPLVVLRVLPIGMVRSLLTVVAAEGGGTRFVISNADLVVREEWARLSTVDSALSATQIVSATMISHASAFPNRSAIIDLNKKDAVRPNDFPSVPAVPATSNDDRQSDGEKKDETQSVCGCHIRQC